MPATYISRSYIPLDRETRLVVEEIPHVDGQFVKPMGGNVIRFLERGICVMDSATMADIEAGAEGVTIFTLNTILHGFYGNAIKRSFTLPRFIGTINRYGTDVPIGEYTISWECRTVRVP